MQLQVPSGMTAVQQQGGPFLVYQLGTNNWQREGEFAPGSGILHEGNPPSCYIANLHDSLSLPIVLQHFTMG